jgi:predicted phage tail protein
VWSTVATTTTQSRNGSVHCRADTTSARTYRVSTADSVESTKPTVPTTIATRIQARDKHRDFMSHHPPAFSHAVEPLDADEWLKIIGKKLDITQCNDWEKVLYALGRLEGAASDWWDAFTAAHTNVDAIT